jgi:hypothetical protein
MAIWKLAPIVASAYDNAWAFTCWYGPTLVRARNPGQARKIAAEALRKAQAGESDTERTSLMSPWLDDALVVCSRVPVSTHCPNGPDQILQPHPIEYNRTC